MSRPDETDAGARVRDHLTTAVADDLRAIVAYDDAGIEPVELREPARSGDPAAKLGPVGAITDESADGGPFGARTASVHRFERVGVVHLPVGSERGVVATVAPTAVDELALEDLVRAVRGDTGD